jgi:glycosyltransferase involved in cell wall biosynthesis
MAKYSFILPVRNGGEYIKACVSSILAQTVQDFNLLILENCSTDGTREWLNTLNHPKIIIYPAPAPLSIEDNWARITSIPKNEFITLTGHDDLFCNDFLKNIDELVSKYPDAGLYHTHFNFIDGNSKLIRKSKAMQPFYTGPDLLQAFLSNSIDSMGTGYAMRSRDYDAIGGIPVKYPSLLFADFELWLQLALQKGMAVSTKTSFSFRVHGGTTGTAPDAKLHEALNIYVDFLVKLSGDNPQYAKILQAHGAEFLLFYCKGFAHRLIRTARNKRKKLTVESFIEQTRRMANKLNVPEQYKPESVSSIKLAQKIDNSSILSILFLLFKKIYSRPVL